LSADEALCQNAIHETATFLEIANLHVAGQVKKRGLSIFWNETRKNSRSKKKIEERRLTQINHTNIQTDRHTD
jgi:hypothetical protein